MAYGFEDDKPLYERALLALEGLFTTWTFLWEAGLAGTGASPLTLVDNNGAVYVDDYPFSTHLFTISNLGVVTINNNIGLQASLERQYNSLTSRYVAFIDFNFAPRQASVWSNGAVLWQRDPSLDHGLNVITDTMAISADGHYLIVSAFQGGLRWIMEYVGS